MSTQIYYCISYCICLSLLPGHTDNRWNPVVSTSPSQCEQRPGLQPLMGRPSLIRMRSRKWCAVFIANSSFLGIVVTMCREYSLPGTMWREYSLHEWKRLGKIGIEIGQRRFRVSGYHSREHILNRRIFAGAVRLRFVNWNLSLLIVHC